MWYKCLDFFPIEIERKNLIFKFISETARYNVSFTLKQLNTKSSLMHKRELVTSANYKENEINFNEHCFKQDNDSACRLMY